jgi:DNA polymerase elongation subunit (family B)
MRILLLDIETSPNTAFVWGLWDQNISISQLIESSEILCYAAKWLGEKDVYFDSIMESSRESMLGGIHGLLDDADVVVHYNGTKFDIPTLNKEFILAGMSPPSPYKQIDLLSTARKQFRFVSNKLDYVAQELGLGKKHETKFTLWVDCMRKDAKAWKLMKAYNINDVIMLEKVYHKFLPWIKTHPNRGMYQEVSLVCPKCGSKHYHARGWYFTSTGKYQRYQCQSCAGWFRDAGVTKNVGPKTKERFSNAS